jgi:hypothetical protein
MTMNGLILKIIEIILSKLHLTQSTPFSYDIKFKETPRGYFDIFINNHTLSDQSVSIIIDMKLNDELLAQHISTELINPNDRKEILSSNINRFFEQIRQEEILQTQKIIITNRLLLKSLRVLMI